MAGKGKRISRGAAFLAALVLAASVWMTPADVHASVTTNQSTVEHVPKNMDQLELKWFAQIGDPNAWMEGNNNAAASSPVQIQNTIYALGNGRLTAVNATDGKVVKAAAESLDSGYNYALSTGTAGGESLIFFQFSKRDPQTMKLSVYVAAYDTQLELKWVSKAAERGSSGYCPLMVDNGVVYGMTASSGTDASAFAIDGVTGEYLWEQPISYTTQAQGWGAMSGSYCAKMTVVGNYVIGGTEGGSIYVFDKKTGELSDRKDLFEDYRYNIRSGMTFADGRLYFTTTDTANSQEARIYAVSFDVSSGKLKDEQFSRITPTAVESVSTPEIYRGRVYVGCTRKNDAGDREGAIAVLNASDLSLVYDIPVPGNEPGWDGSYNNKCTNPALAVDAADGTVYGYAAYYDTPGAFVGFCDRAGQTEADFFNAKAVIPDECKNYSASSVLLGDDGNIYFTNDSGYLMCAGSKVVMSEGDKNQENANDSSTGSEVTEETPNPPAVSPKTGDTRALPEFLLAALVPGAAGIALMSRTLRRRQN